MKTIAKFYGLENLGKYATTDSFEREQTDDPFEQFDEDVEE